MSHSHHTQGVGSDVNHAFAKDYWYIAAGVVGLGTIIHGVNYLDARSRLRSCRDASIPHPTRPDGRLSQAWATATAIVREMGHPQLYISTRGLRWATPPPLGRILVLLAYWAMIIYFMSWKVVVKDVFYWERIGYRNAWVTLAQLPMLYLLAMKVNPVGFLIGSSHERLNWLHRWVARTMFVTATVHGFHFYTMWDKADFVAYTLRVMPLVRYGLASWAILLWLGFSGMLPIRRLWYEVWVAQHVLASILILWLLYMHIPASARYLLWMSISFIVFDRAARWALLAWRNVHILPNRAACKSQKRIGHHITLKAVGPATTVVTVNDVHFKWHAGQHVYLWLPRIGLLEGHPYTIACAHKQRNEPGSCHCNSIQLIVRAHGGFSRRLYDYATKNPGKGALTGFLSGPYGAAPTWNGYETLVLLGASTGASFTVPIFESVARGSEGESTCVRAVEMVLLARTVVEMEYYIERSREAALQARARGIQVRLHVAITGKDGGQPPGLILGPSGSESEILEPSEKKQAAPCCDQGCSCNPVTTSVCCCGSPPIDATSEETPLEEYSYTSRPDIKMLIRAALEKAYGETAVVVCGGKELVARTRNSVAALSDERAVHKGTGAQGIYLHVEEYAF